MEQLPNEWWNFNITKPNSNIFNINIISMIYKKHLKEKSLQKYDIGD